MDEAFALFYELADLADILFEVARFAHSFVRTIPFFTFNDNVAEVQKS